MEAHKWRRDGSKWSPGGWLQMRSGHLDEDPDPHLDEKMDPGPHLIDTDPKFS